MTPGARVTAAIELLDKIWGDPIPATNLIKRYFNQRRFAGSKDRRAIKKLVYAIIRHHQRLHWWFRQTENSSLFCPRTAVIAYFSIIKNFSTEPLLALFSGLKYSPLSLSIEEKELAEELEHFKIHQKTMPRFVIGEYPDWMDDSLYKQY